MLQIEYNRPKHCVTIKGHAYFAEKGQDIVCAASSMLACTLAGDVEKLGESVKRVKIQLDPGDAVISCDHTPGMKHVVSLIFDSICTGWEMLAHEYPDKVSYVCRDR